MNFKRQLPKTFPKRDFTGITFLIPPLKLHLKDFCKTTLQIISKTSPPPTHSTWPLSRDPKLSLRPYPSKTLPIVSFTRQKSQGYFRKLFTKNYHKAALSINFNAIFSIILYVLLNYHLNLTKNKWSSIDSHLRKCK